MTGQVSGSNETVLITPNTSVFILCPLRTLQLGKHQTVQPNKEYNNYENGSKTICKIVFSKHYVLLFTPCPRSEMQHYKKGTSLYANDTVMPGLR